MCSISGQNNDRERCMMRNFLIGIFSGCINGLLGSGGGTVVVPALEVFKKIEPHKAHATAIAVILPLSVISSLIYMFKGSLNWEAVLYVALGSIPGSIIGAKLLKKLSSRMLSRLFGAVLIFASARMMMS
ncbi:MAG: sulfite exporter TauE/SafE family protein [Firmicutes bacterium]|nr:sulfite exporter TauE/SafE family protein [Bacillota bacterium]